MGGAQSTQLLEHIEVLQKPTFKDLQIAAYYFDKFATLSKLEYILVGSFAARLQSGNDYTVYSLEILLEGWVMANNRKKLNGIIGRMREDCKLRLANPTSEEDIIIVRENIGVVLNLIEAGTEFYPNIPPRSTSHDGQQSYRYHNLG